MKCPIQYIIQYVCIHMVFIALIYSKLYIYKNITLKWKSHTKVTNSSSTTTSVIHVGFLGSHRYPECTFCRTKVQFPSLHRHHHYRCCFVAVRTFHNHFFAFSRRQAWTQICAHGGSGKKVLSKVIIIFIFQSSLTLPLVVTLDYWSTQLESYFRH